MDCFNLKERRSGEICNACVLLVKRWKKLPKGTDRNWHHVSILKLMANLIPYCIFVLSSFSDIVSFVSFVSGHLFDV